MNRTDAETIRLLEDSKRIKNWKRWGPYLSERQWGTVREDYSQDGICWQYFPHEHARSRTYRWGEDGILGITDREGRLCFGIALWNGKDPILKERLFGLSNSEGNHGEDVKECYFYLDSTPTHSYMKALYKYPQDEFPYELLIEENRRRGLGETEFELQDTGIFNKNHYFDIFAEYAKKSPNDILIRITLANRSPESAIIHFLPTLWFRNTWSWGRTGEGYWQKPKIELTDDGTFLANHATLGKFALKAASAPDGKKTQILFTENETNFTRLFSSKNRSQYVKDAFHEYIIHGNDKAISSEGMGTKAAFHYKFEIPSSSDVTIRLRLYAEGEAPDLTFGESFDRIFACRIREADEFYNTLILPGFSTEESHLMRQACAGLLWTKQFYHYVVKDWLEGDPAQPPASRKNSQNNDWKHLYNRDIISMPDKWEYPWYAAWDLAFHMIPFARIDPHFAKEQLILLLREWYMHPNGQIPAYEFNFCDVNPPVHAWASWRIYKITGPRGKRDRLFLSKIFHKLLINFTWWINRKYLEGNNLFSGGFLGLDNIGVFDRSKPLPMGGILEQADGTSWMAFYCATMLSMALELATEDPSYEDVASKFFEHFVAIADAINTLGGSGLWDEEDGFYYDMLHVSGKLIPLKVRSMVGIMPLFAVEILEQEVIDRLPGFSKRMHWFLENRRDLSQHISYMETPSQKNRALRLLAIPSRDHLVRVLKYILDEKEFLSPYGIRSLSSIHLNHPYLFKAGNLKHEVKYIPGESDNRLFGGNSNWRGPVWFPVNYLLIEALERYHHFYGDTLRIECPTGSGQMMNLKEVACEITKRLVRIFLKGENEKCPWYGNEHSFSDDPYWQNLTLFHECFHGDTGRGIGASHQTGWTALIIRFIEDFTKNRI